MTEDSDPRQDERTPGDLELSDDEAELVGGSDKAATQRPTVGEITITKQIDVATPKLYL